MLMVRQVLWLRSAWRPETKTGTECEMEEAGKLEGEAGMGA